MKNCAEMVMYARNQQQISRVTAFFKNIDQNKKYLKILKLSTESYGFIVHLADRAKLIAKFLRLIFQSFQETVMISYGKV